MKESRLKLAEWFGREAYLKCIGIDECPYPACPRGDPFSFSQMQRVRWQTAWIRAHDQELRESGPVSPPLPPAA